MLHIFSPKVSEHGTCICQVARTNTPNENQCGSKSQAKYRLLRDLECQRPTSSHLQGAILLSLNNAQIRSGIKAAQY